MNVNRSSLAIADTTLDYIPICSTLSNLTALFTKVVVLPCKDPQRISEGSYYAHIREKKLSRCAILLVPLIGQIALLQSDRKDRLKALLIDHTTQWAMDSSITGNKQAAFRKILQAFEENSKTLDLSGLELSSLPSSIGYLKNLKKLKARHNRLSTLPEELWNLTKLTHLYFGYNHLEELSGGVGNLRNLTRLDLRSNRIVSIPPSFGNLINLERLSLAHNSLSNLPEEFSYLDNLIELDLTSNSLQVVPSSITSLANLEGLSLASNNLNELPHSIEGLVALENLYLQNNHLTRLPEQLYNLTALRGLDLSHNPLEHLPFLANTQIEAILYGTPLDRNSLDLWQERAQTHYAFQSFESLSESDQFTIKEWLRRLERTNEFNNVNQQELAKVVVDILNTVLNPPEDSDFPAFFFDQVQSNNENCQDRAAMALNELFTVWKIKTLQKSSSLQTAAPLIIASLKAHALRVAIANSISGKNQRESVEIYLYYEIVVRALYQKPIGQQLIAPLSLIRQMSYPYIGRREEIDEENLFQQVESSYLDFLLHFPLFETIIEEDEFFKRSWEKKDEVFFERLETAESQDELLKERKMVKLEMMQERLIESLTQK